MRIPRVIQEVSETFLTALCAAVSRESVMDG